MKKILLVTLCLSLAKISFATNPICNRVLEYVPAPGQFVNQLPEYEPGDNQQTMSDKVYDYIINEDAIVTLGAYGGYVTYGFESTIVNVPGKRDFYVEGNAIQTNSSTTKGGSSEPGIIMVSYDLNKNGLPDDIWFEIAGSEYDATVSNYEITYYKPNSINEDIKWTDNMGDSGFVPRMEFHKQAYWPEWITDETMSFKGSLLPNNSKKEGNEVVLLRYDFGYADNYPNFMSDKKTRNEGAKIDIDWAVDEDGNAVKMPGVDFVRVYTGINATNGILGENSTEIKRIINNHTKMVGNVESVDESIKMDRQILSDFINKYGDGAGIDELNNENLRVYISSNGLLSFALNQSDLVQIYNLSGVQVHSEIMEEGPCSFDLSEYPAGLYLVKVGNVINKVMKK